MLGVLTEADSVEKVFALKPDGTLAEIVVPPDPPGWNDVVAPAEPAGMVTGLVVMVPTLVFELVTLTLTGVPGATNWSIGPLGSSIADSTVIVVGAELLVVEIELPIPNGPAKTIPEGRNETVPVAVPRLPT
jgi:hypothetical protein